MKTLLSVITAFPKGRTSRQNLAVLTRLLLLLAVLVSVYSALFHALMQWEGRQHSWLTGFYWTLTVMTTLGFGDITFHSDLGRFFSMVVLVSGVFFMLILLPFTFIEFFYAPWMQAQTAARTPRELPPQTSDHLILTRHGPVTSLLIPMLEKYHHPYVVLAPTVAEALELYEKGVHVMVGELDDPQTYRKARVSRARMVVTTRTDVINTNVTFTVRELTDRVPVVASAAAEAAAEVLRLAGASYILRLDELTGQFLGRRVLGNDAVAHVIGEIDGLLLAEANAAGTPLVGKTLRGSGLRENLGINVVGVWERGQFVSASPETPIAANTVLVLAGTREQINRYNELLCIYHRLSAPVLVVGAGRVGQVTARTLRERQLDYRVLELSADQAAEPERTIIGNATQIEILERAGVREAAAVVLTTHDDDVNIYLSMLCRRLQPSIQIVSRCSLERNVATLQRAGANLVVSYGAMGANAIFNLVRGGDILLLAEGVNAFPAPVPPGLAGLSIAESGLRPKTGCTIVAVELDGRRIISPSPELRLPAGGRLVLIGTLDAEEKFLREFPTEAAVA